MVPDHAEEDPEEEFSNPEIYKPSPPRAGAQRLFMNPFYCTDEESAPMDPAEKLSPSHVFESTSLEESLLLLSGKASPMLHELSHKESRGSLSHSESNASSLASSIVSSTRSARPFDTRTFVVR